MAGLRLPRPVTVERSQGGRLAEIALQPRLLAATACGILAYLLMNFVMTAAPLVMRLCGLSQDAANLGLQWHVIATYAPSFVTVRLIARFGAPRPVVVGLAPIAAAAVVGLAGVEVAHFWLSLDLLGMGWNFGFLGAFALVLDCHRSKERTRMHSSNDFLVFGTMALGSFASGGLPTGCGWETVLQVSFVPLGLASLASLVTVQRVRRAAR
ncbi:hypothetical protein [Cereibacter sphaeroides]|uniref:hypothetical protein n=1 Tax=Cereibacter sphaeroides TaxID=1063 RepID=UPI000674D03E|nr:hypothetical protein [Cereibacter sphaeroides]